MISKPSIVLACADGDSTRAIASALEKRFGQISVVMENPVSKWQMIKRRAKKLGVVTTGGQVVFIAFLVPLLRYLGRNRISKLETEFDLQKSLPANVINVESINSEQSIDAFRKLKPEVVVISGTRIISRNVLSAIDAPFINMHAGITPSYRGVHGAYWALFEGKPELVGTTVHLVDPGIDTGGIIEQAFFEVDNSDSFATYPYLHTASGIPALIRAVESALNGTLQTKPHQPGLVSELRYHPTIWQYVQGRLMKGVR
jgi:folate-dependent phosphoribosylglycinamide formyltransferase PurN